MKTKTHDDPLAEFCESLNLDQTESTILEKIMREDVFHSTLDWQTRDEIIAGAKEAYQLFRADEAFHRASLRCQKARFRFLKAGGENPEVEPSPELEKAREEYEAAARDFDQYLSPECRMFA